MGARLDIGQTLDGQPFTLPIDTATLAMGTFGIRGSGKTNTAGRTAEELLSAKQQVVIIDPTNAWWGLRSSADGKAPGFAIPILGGPHGDIPLDKDMGAAVGDWLVETRSSAILSVRHMRKGAIRKFVMHLLEQIYHRKADPRLHTPMTLFSDEASITVPQRVSNETAQLVGAYENIVRQGRSSGLGMGMVDQRPASVNKDVLSQCEGLFIHRVTGTHDRKALRECIEQHDTGGAGREFLDTLASLPNGRAWFWSPVQNIFALVNVHLRRTFDSSRTPKLGEEIPPPAIRAEVNIQTLRDALREALASAEADNPETLKGRIAELEAELEGRGPRVSVPVAAVAALSSDSDAAAALAKQEALASLHAISRRLENLREGADAALREAEAAVREMGGEPRTSQAPVRAARPASPPSAAVPPAREASAPPHAPAATPAAQLTPAQVAILTSLLAFKKAGAPVVAKSNAAVFAGISPLSSQFQNNLSALLTLGLIEYPRPGFARITARGEQRTPAPAQPATRARLLDAWCRYLDERPAAMLRLLATIPKGRSIGSDDLAERTGQSHRSSAYDGHKRTLVSLGLAWYPEPKRVAITDLLTPAGLR